ncbi:MAG: hypothetical protein EPN21_18880 [Methylococcaceae bacterium]|nr:MAG: hypothetical protein EPN21_18880 [Methylococcaceae bacterium]
MNKILTAKIIRLAKHGFKTRLLAAAAMTCSILSMQLPADPSNAVLILNSDNSVGRYALAQSTFEASQTGEKIIIDLGDGQPHDEVIQKLFQQSKIKITYAIGSNAYMLINQLAADSKIIFSSAINWQRLPLEDHTFGVSNELPAGMQLMTFRYLFPDVRKIGIVYSEKFNEEWVAEAVKSARDAGIEIIGKSIDDHTELAPALRSLLPKVDALWLISDPSVLSSKDATMEIFGQSNAMKKPVFAYDKIYTDLGALLIISPDIYTISRQAAALVDDLLTGTKITEKVVSPAGSHVILNMKTLNSFNVRLNQDALDSVNQVIE